MKEQVEEYKFRKEIDTQKEKMIENMEKNKTKKQLDKDQLERIKLRGEELLMKKHQIIKSKQEQLVPKGLAPSKVGEQLKNKVESKLLVETKAMLDKKREKYDPDKDGPGRIANTMGGQILGSQLRQPALWRAGI